MKKNIVLLLALACTLIFFSAPSRADTLSVPCLYNNNTGCNPVTKSNPLPVTPLGGAATNAFSGSTVGTTHAQVLAAGTHSYLFLQNVAAAGGNTIYCSFGGTAVANAAGTISIAPGQPLTWENSFVPSDAIDCIATGASTPLTVGVH
jgi:hypothetical protein